MEMLSNIIHKILIFEKEPQKVGLSQFKETSEQPRKKEIVQKNKEIKLSDLMRGAN